MKMSDTAVLIIDMQQFFLKRFDKVIRDELILNHIKFLQFCLKNKMPVITTEYKCRGIFRGHLIPQLEKMIKKNLIASIIKESNSGFVDTNLHTILEKLKIQKIIIIGVNANACVQDTAKGAICRGFKVITSKGLIGSAGRKDLGLSNKNEKWYRYNTLFFECQNDLLKYLLK